MTRPREPGATRSRYSGGAIAFHWAIALLIIANIALALVTDDWHGPARSIAIQIHKATGLTILVLSVARLAWRLAHRPPPFPAGIRRWEAVAARAAHCSFYALMIVLPMSGWLMVSASANRKPLSWYWLFDLPYLPVQGDKAIGGFAHETHEILGYTLIALVVLHVAAALKHHYGDRTRLIARMWPGQVAASR
ncbi:cytochrome b [Sphingomonas sp. MAH-20]|uniref:Cytochrome b n=1 Tax=Sphingomonas horti TaxID=2682842 RepID=A0A6I4J1G8_9SPHN|nr:MULTISPECIES: cytochrome b [Sphingomonas]MBA2920063.1 cytochrome b [Sphingomonas sp. CGMCC 1.13658]MVO77943.1 cytochrome b [Sphingomonas horti]